MATAKTEKIKTELRWLTNELAPARELDVFLEEKIGPVAREIISQRGGKAIAREFADKFKEIAGLNRLAAVHFEHHAGEEVRLVGCQEQRRVGDILRRRKTSKRDAGAEFLAQRVDFFSDSKCLYI